MPESSPTCPHCRYPLGGLADEGTCPECGQPYTRVSASPGISMPSRRGVTAGLAVPLVVALSSFALLVLDVFFGNGGASCVLLFTLTAALFWMCIATPIIIGAVHKSHRSMGRSGGWWTALGTLGSAPRLLVVGHITLILLAALGFGACVIAFSIMQVH